MGKKNRLLDYKKNRKSLKATIDEKLLSQQKSSTKSESKNCDFTFPNNSDENSVNEILANERKQNSRMSEMTVATNTNSESAESNISSQTENSIMTSSSSRDLETPISVASDNLKSSDVCKDASKQPSFQVYVRIRPLDEIGSESSSTRVRSLSVENNNQVMLCTRPSKGKESNGTKHLFTFARVFTESTSQRDVFEVTTQSLVNAVLNGNRTCVVSYGVPNSGKSYTLYGKASSGKHRGIIMRAMESMLNIVNNDASTNTTYQITTSFIQIYNEKYYDLLDPSASEGLKIQENGDVTWIEGATEIDVKTADDVSRQLRRSPNRMRDAGSRSHTVFTVRLKKEEMMTSPDNDVTAENVKVTKGEMRFVDLVGVERSVKHASYESPAVGTAEAKTVKSLQLFATLVISLANDKDAVVPYRDSKLTRLMKNALGGDCLTRMIVTASPCPSLAHETLSCLQFAQKACLVVNRPIPKVDVVNRAKEKQQSDTEIEKEQKSHSPTPSTRSQPYNKLPPIYSTSGHRLSTSAEEQRPSSNKNDPPSRPTSQNENVFCENSPIIDEAKRNKHDSTPPSPGSSSKTSSADSRKHGSSDGLLYLHVKSAESGNKVVSLPLLTSSGAGHIFSQPTVSTFAKQTERLHDVKLRATNDGNVRQSKRRDSTNKQRRMTSTEKTRQTSGVTGANSTPQQNEKTSQIMSFEGSECVVEDLQNHARKRISPTLPKDPELVVVIPEGQGSQNVGVKEKSADKACCNACSDREAKIKADYDRMILFSKKDRDDKQAKIEELHLEIKKLKNETASMNTIRLLEEERSQDKIAKEIQGKEIVRLESLVETLKIKLSGMVNGNEVTSLQELRRKDHVTMEKLRGDIENLKLHQKDESEKHRREIGIKTDTIKKTEREMTQLKKEVTEKEKALNDSKKHQEEKAATASLESQRMQERHEVAIAELNSKLTASMKEVTKYKESEMKMTKQRQDEKENLERELALAKQTAAQSQAELKIAHGKLVSLEREQRIARSNGGYSAMSSSRASLRRSMDRRDTGTAMSNSPDSERDGSCLTCGKQLNRRDISSDINRDEELRILLLQDARNREVLIQLKRERNLLCDVMKIMYCRQWFVEEAGPHIKRTLRRVGIDTRSLNTLRKKL